MRLKLFHFPILLILFSCTGNQGDADSIAYADYSIVAGEETENVTCVLKFYRFGPRDLSVFLKPPATVSFDGAALQGDSAGLSGAFYEVQKPLDSFAGTHTIIFKSSDGKEHKETFDFQPLKLAAGLSETIPRGDISLQLEGLAPDAPVRVLLTDTSFYTADINEIDTVRNGTLVITREALQNVASGPVTLHLIKEDERPLQAWPGRRSKLSVTYSLARAFELVD